MKLRETAAPGIDPGLFGSSTRQPERTMIKTRTVVLTFRAEAIVVDPHNVCFNLHIQNFQMIIYITDQIRKIKSYTQFQQQPCQQGISFHLYMISKQSKIEQYRSGPVVAKKCFQSRANLLQEVSRFRLKKNSKKIFDVLRNKRLKVLCELKTFGVILSSRS